MNCDIVIPVHNQPDYTKACIESIKQHTGLKHRIVVVDDASGDSQARKCLEDLNANNEIILLRNETNLGWLKSANKGMMYSDAPYICLMNNDTLVTRGWLDEMATIASREDDIGLVNPCWEKPEKYSPDEYARKILNFKGTYVDTDWARGFCVLIKRQVIEKIGYLDEIYSPGYFDDHDFSVRAIKAGFRCVRAKASFVLHHRNATFGETLKSHAFNSVFERNRGTFYQRWGRPLNIVFVAPDLPPRFSNAFYKFLIGMVRGQNRVHLLTSGNASFSRHDNLFPARFSRWLFWLCAILFIWDNSRRNPAKRYDLIFVYSSGKKGLLPKLWFMNKYRVLFFDSFEPEAMISLTNLIKDSKFSQEPLCQTKCLYR